MYNDRKSLLYNISMVALAYSDVLINFSTRLWGNCKEKIHYSVLVRGPVLLKVRKKIKKKVQQNTKFTQKSTPNKIGTLNSADFD
jgi:hypothetical protein